MPWYVAAPQAAWWPWLFAVLAVGALILALMPFPQMIWGKPRIVFELDNVVTEPGFGLLMANVRNPPLQNKALLALGIRRTTVADVSLTLSIENAGGTKVYDQVMPIYGASREPTKRTALPPSWQEEHVPLAGIHEGLAWAGDPADNVKLSPGWYLMSLVAVGSEPTTGVVRAFVVHKDPPCIELRPPVGHESRWRVWRKFRHK